MKRGKVKPLSSLVFFFCFFNNVNFVNVSKLIGHGNKYRASFEV